nr:MAG TPA: hypothetical protein [Caudoviricetes sp.]
MLGGGASQRQRDERLRRLTLLSVLCSLLSFFFLALFFSSLFFVEWRVSCSARAAMRART